MTQSFGSVVVGVSSDAQTFTVSNTGNAESGSINATVGGDFAITNNTCTVALGSGDMCKIDVVFTPSAASPRSATLTVSSAKGGTVSSSLTGTGTTAGKLTISPSTQPLGSSVVGTVGTGSASFTITNTGASTTGTLTATVGGANAADFAKGATDTCTGQTLAANATCTVTATFKPTDVGSRVGEIDVSATPGGAVTGSLTGTGLAPAQLSVAPTSQDFGSIVQGQSGVNQSFTVKNTGGVATTAITTSVTGANSTDFPVSSNTCTTPLAAGASCTILIKFSPTTITSEVAVLNVAATTGGNASSTLTGLGLAPGLLTIDPPTFGFTDTVVGQNSASSVFTVKNTGAAATTALAVSLGGTAPSEFRLVAGGNGCTGTLGAGATCTIAVTFSPDARGPQTAQLQVQATTGGTVTAGLSGTALGAAKLQINPASNDYGSVAVGGTSTSNPVYTVTNTGDQTSTAVSVAIGGANATQFGITANTCTGALAAGASCQTTLSFSPTSPGAKSATLTASATTGGNAVATLFGNGNDSAIQVGTPSLSPFGLTNIGDTSASLSFQVKNTGNSSSGAITAAVSGANAADFTVDSSACNILGEDATCNVKVTFAPTATPCDLTTGSCERDAVITVSATPGGTFTQVAKGFAQPRLEVSNAGSAASAWPLDSFTFPNTIANTTVPPTEVFTLTNNGSAATLQVTPASLTAPFSVIGGNCGATLGAGASCTVDVQFLPTAAGLSTTTITGSLGGGGAANTSQVKVTGTGIDSIALTCNSADAGCVNTPAVKYDFSTSPTLPTPLGTASVAETFTVTNGGNAPTTGSVQSSVTGPFHIVTDNCAGRAQSTTPCTLLVKFTPTTTGANQTGTLTVTGTPGGTVTAALSGTAVGAANLTISATSEDFGTLFSGESSNTAGNSGDKTITITNATGAATSSALQIGNLAGAGSGAFTLNPGTAQTNDCLLADTTTLAAGASCNIRIRYTTTSAFATSNASFTVSAATGLATTTVNLKGTAQSDTSIAPGSVLAAFDFGAHDANTTTTQTFTVTNNSHISVTPTSATLLGIGGTGANGLSVTTNNCTAALASGATCTIIVTYAAHAGDNDLASLTVDSNSGTPTVTNSGVAVTEIAATGLTAAAFTVSPASYAFGAVLQGQTGTSTTYTVKNTGGSTGNVGFVNHSDGNFKVVNGCGTTLAGGATCSVAVTFTPVVTGTTNPGLSETFSVTGGAAGTFTGTSLQSGTVTVNPSNVDFAAITGGTVSAPTTITVQNGALSNQTVAPTAPANFAIVANTCPTTTAPTGGLVSGGTCTFGIESAPGAGVTGPTSGNVTVSGAAFVAVTGAGLKPATLQFRGCVGTNLTNDPQVAVGATASTTCTFKNTGDVTTPTITATIGGNDAGQFSVVNNCTTLAAGASCTTVTTFHPSTVGTKNASFTIAAGTISVPGVTTLQASGVNEASLGISPSVPFVEAARPLGDTNDGGKTFTITNGGDVSTGPLGVTLSNTTDYSLFNVTNNGVGFTNGGTCLTKDIDGNVVGYTMPANTTCTVTVKFDPQTVATGLTTTLTVTETHNSVTSTVSNTLTGDSSSALITSAGLTAAAPDDFGSGSVDTQVGSDSITITNKSGSPTGALTTSLGGANGATDYSIVSDGCEGTPLAAGGSCTIQVVFVPQTTGTKTATLTVSGAILLGTTSPAASVSTFLTGKSNAAPVGP